MIPIWDNNGYNFFIFKSWAQHFFYGLSVRNHMSRKMQKPIDKNIFQQSFYTMPLPKCPIDITQNDIVEYHYIGDVSPPEDRPYKP